LTLTNGPPECESVSAGILIDVNGRVLSNNLLAGQQLTGTLIGNEFTLTGSDNRADVSGTIVFNGTVVGNRIIGSVSGSATTGSDAGSYSGSFAMNQQ
jgi:hypothetical protein